MRWLNIVLVAAAVASVTIAGPVKPTALHQLKTEDKEIEAKPGDMVAVRPFPIRLSPERSTTSTSKRQAG